MLCSTSSFLCGQPCIIYAFRFCRWVSSHVTTCMSSVEVHIGKFHGVMMALTFMLILVMSWSLLSVWLFWDSWSTMCKSGPGLYMICTLHWCILSIYVVTTETVWPHLYWVLPLMAYGQWWCILPSWSSSGGTSLNQVVSKELHILCCYSIAQCFIGFCWQMQLNTVLCCLVLLHAHN